MTIKYLTFEVWPDCNMDCNFCFSSWREQYSKVDTQTAKKTIEILNNQGLEAISFTGGEPLLRKDLPELIQYSKELGLTTVLTTNGILLERRLPKIADYVDYVNLPLDSANEEVHNYMRPTKSVENHHQHINDLLNLMQEKYPDIGVKINTMVSKQNYDSILGIGELIKDKTIAWKLSQFISSGYGAEHEDEFKIGLEQYRTSAKECQETYSNMNIIVAEAHSNDDACRVISVDGHLLKPTMQGLEEIGDLLEMTEEEMINEFNSEKNELFFKKTYENESTNSN